MSAQSKALSVPEILEAILLELPLRDLLTTAPRVSKPWNEAISSSATLQQALFFQPRPDCRSEGSEFNPLLKWAFPKWFPPGNPREDSMFIRLDWNKSPEKTIAYSRASASWRRMLPAQPPRVVLQVKSTSHYIRRSWASEGEVMFSQGVRMATLYDYAYRTVKRPNSRFTIDWGCQEQPSSSGDGNGDQSVVKMHTYYTAQCRMGIQPDVGPKFRSEAYEDLVVEFGESRRLR